MIAAIHAVHEQGILHCDLKPQNFILFRRVTRSRDHSEELGTGAPVLFEHEKYMLKLCDFGVSRKLEDSATHVSEKAPIGTVRYMAPEVLHDCRSDGKLLVGKAADKWSIGIVLHQMLHQGLTPHSHVELRGNRLRLMLAIADEKSARVKSSCPRLLQPSQSTGSPSRGNESAVRLASARHAALIGLQSACLQFFPKERASTEYLVSVTEEKKRLFVGSDVELQFHSDGRANATTEAVRYEQNVLMVDWNDVGTDHTSDIIGMFDAQAGEKPRRSSDERSVLFRERPRARPVSCGCKIFGIISITISVLAMGLFFGSFDANGPWSYGPPPWSMDERPRPVFLPPASLPTFASSPPPTSPPSSPSPPSLSSPPTFLDPVSRVSIGEGVDTSSTTGGSSPTSTSLSSAVAPVRSPPSRQPPSVPASPFLSPTPPSSPSAFVWYTNYLDMVWYTWSSTTPPSSPSAFHKLFGKLDKESGAPMFDQVDPLTEILFEDSLLEELSEFLDTVPFYASIGDANMRVIKVVSDPNFLKHKHDWVRFRAVQVVRRLVAKEQVRAFLQADPDHVGVLIAAVSGLLTDKADRVRRVTVEALAQLAKKGDTEAIAAVLARLEDEGANVRAAAIKALEHLAMKGDKKVITAVLNSVNEDESDSVRVRATKSLEHLAEKGDAGVIEAVAARLDDKSDYVRTAAVEALAQLAHLAGKGDAGVIASISARLLDDSGSGFFRIAAVEALAQLAEKGDAAAIASVSARLKDSAVDVRTAATTALAQLAEKGDAPPHPLSELFLETTPIIRISNFVRRRTGDPGADVGGLRADAAAGDKSGDVENDADLAHLFNKGDCSAL